MLTYHPIYDSSHCLFRMLHLLGNLEKSPQEVDKIRLFDFYLCVPHSLKLLRSNSIEMQRMKNLILKNFSSYDEVDNSKALFFDVKEIQSSVLNHLAAKDIISTEKYRKNFILTNDAKFKSIEDSVKLSKKSILPDVMSLIATELQHIPVLGPDGLKHRSKLIEYRYDVT